jgi:hypothetical protein
VAASLPPGWQAKRHAAVAEALAHCRLPIAGRWIHFAHDQRIVTILVPALGH